MDKYRKRQARLIKRLVKRSSGKAEFRKPQGPKSGLAAIIGKWPGDETDEEVDAALRELS